MKPSADSKYCDLGKGYNSSFGWRGEKRKRKGCDFSPSHPINSEKSNSHRRLVEFRRLFDELKFSPSHLRQTWYSLSSPATHSHSSDDNPTRDHTLPFLTKSRHFWRETELGLGGVLVSLHLSPSLALFPFQRRERLSSLPVSFLLARTLAYQMGCKGQSLWGFKFLVRLLGL